MRANERKDGRGMEMNGKTARKVDGWSWIEGGWRESGWQERVMFGQGWMEENVDGWKDGLDEYAVGTERLMMEIFMEEKVNTCRGRALSTLISPLGYLDLHFSQSNHWT
jgi:hypothetical protein